jgi:hypothetical protein
MKSLGIPPVPAQFLTYGLSMLSVSIVDNTHLLLTFATRGLVPRLPDDPPEDDDRMVAAELVELPSGRVLARADWHLHDHGQYLWRLGHGRFLVRSRNSLGVLAPLALLRSENPLAAAALPDRPGRPIMAQVSPDGAVVMIESQLPASPTMDQTTPGAPAELRPREAAPVLIDFYRLQGGDAPGSTLSVRGAGVVRSPTALMLPLDGDGYLWPGEGQRSRWAVSFNEFGGKSVPVGTVDSSCMPRLQMVSRFQYLAFACQGSDDRQKLHAFGMDGHENWQESLPGPFTQPVFAFAPDAGRFAMSRISAPIGIVTDSVVPDSATQEVRVYQTESGDLLLRVPCTPVLRNAENFDLSPDGSLLAVINAGAVQVYRLPTPTEKDKKELKEAADFAPPRADGPVLLTRLTRSTGAAEFPTAESTTASPKLPNASGSPAPSTGADADTASGAAAPPPAPDTAPAAAAPPAPRGPTLPDERSGAELGDATGQPRRPPSLLNPGEKAEYHDSDKSKQPQ